MHVKIEANGAIIVGENFTIDGHSERNFRVVTHFHSDHIVDLSKSVKECNGVVATPQTLDALEVLGHKIPQKKRLGLKYDLRLHVEDESVVLKPAEHILGSAQVMITLKDGTTVAYTGDFKNPGKGTPILNPDILVIDSTYGRPEFRRPFKEEVNSLFPDYVNDALVSGPVRIYAYHGKIQEVMKFLRRAQVIAPFVAEGKVYDLTIVAKKYGEEIGEVFNRNDPQAREILKEGWYVEFKHFHEFRNREKGFTNFVLTGWQFDKPFKRIDSSSVSVAFSDHGDFEETIYYVDNSSASLVIVDGGRRGYSNDLAKYINERLKKKAISMP